jgi:hypothetical protein
MRKLEERSSKSSCPREALYPQCLVTYRCVRVFLYRRLDYSPTVLPRQNSWSWFVILSCSAASSNRTGLMKVILTQHDDFSNFCEVFFFFSTRVVTPLLLQVSSSYLLHTILFSVVPCHLSHSILACSQEIHFINIHHSVMLKEYGDLLLITVSDQKVRVDQLDQFGGLYNPAKWADWGPVI